MRKYTRTTECYWCGKEFIYPIRKYTDKIRQQCDECVNSHKGYSNNEKAYCTHCKKYFKTHQGLLIHQAIARKHGEIDDRL